MDNLKQIYGWDFAKVFFYTQLEESVKANTYHHSRQKVPKPRKTIVSSVFYFFHFVNKQKIMYIFEEQNVVTTLFLFIQKIFNFRAVK